MRKYDIDHLRWITVLVLFPYHTARIFDFNQSFYITGEGSLRLTWLVQFCAVWFMPLLFTLAGMSASYALQKRSPAEFIAERFRKLFVPFIAGLVVLIPPQTYLAKRFHRQETRSFLAYYPEFFKNITDLSGYDGGFTPAHLWFIWYLFLISLLAVLLLTLNKRYLKIALPKLKGALFLAVIPIDLLSYLGDMGGKSLGESFAFFVLGGILLTDDDIRRCLEQSRIRLSVAAVFLAGLSIRLSISQELTHLLATSASWAAVLALLGWGKRYLSFTNPLTKKLSASSFGVYLFHQSWIVIWGYVMLQSTHSSQAVLFLLILVLALISTFLTIELVRRLKITQFLFGIK